MTSEYPVVLQEGVAPEVANSLPRPQLAPSHLPGEARVASDCKHNCDLHTYQRGALHSWPALLLYRQGSLRDPTPRWQEQFWSVPRRSIPIAGVPISATRGVGRKGDDAASRSDPTFTRASQGIRQ